MQPWQRSKDREDRSRYISTTLAGRCSVCGRRRHHAGGGSGYQGRKSKAAK